MNVWTKLRRWRETEKFRSEYLWYHKRAVKYRYLMHAHDNQLICGDNIETQLSAAQRIVEQIRIEQRFQDVRYYKGQDTLDPDIHYLVVNRLF